MGGRGSGSASGTSRAKTMAKFSGSAAEYHTPFEKKNSYNKAFAKASFEYETNYVPYAWGQITKTDAGQLYKAVKNGDVKALPETTKSLYDQTEASVKYADERYRQNYVYYSNVSKLTNSLLNKDYKRAQALINEIEYNSIELSGRKSEYYKYKSKLKQ